MPRIVHKCADTRIDLQQQYVYVNVTKIYVLSVKHKRLKLTTRQNTSIR